MNAAAALFGKLPSQGDFVARGLPAGLRLPLDRWLTRHLALRAKRPETWPVDGLRITFGFEATTLTGLILPSSDRAGRAFPLACCHLPGLSLDAAEEWCDAALPSARAALAGAISADSLQAALAALPADSEDPAEPGIWAGSHAPLPPDPAEAALAVLRGPVSSGKSCCP